MKRKEGIRVQLIEVDREEKNASLLGGKMLKF